MRLLCTIPDIAQGKNFSNFLNNQGIENNYEVSENECRIWVFDEDLVPTALDWFQRFQQDPGAPLFQQKAPPSPPKEEKQEKVEAPFSKEPLGKVNFVILLLCALISFFSHITAPVREPIPTMIPHVAAFASPIKKALLYDYPKAYTFIDKIVHTYGSKSLQEPNELPLQGKILFKQFEETPYWHGFYSQVLHYFSKIPIEKAPLFEKISQGEIWRLFTPALMHADIFHLVFNMIWLIVIGKQMENRLGMARYLLFILLAAIFSNTAQYLMSGPNFLGFSGVLCAMIVFVWMRQRRTPWEGYFLQPATWTFFAFFILLMFVIQLSSFLLEITLHQGFSANIANTAHLSGAFIGYLFGRLNFFCASYRVP